MGFAVIFFAFAALFTWAAVALQSHSSLPSLLAAAVFYQAALAELIMCLLYLSASLFKINPGRLFKTPQGKLKMVPRFFTWPYLFFEFTGWRRYRKDAREPLFEEVRPGLFLGARIIEADLPALESAGISAVLDLVGEFKAPAAVRGPAYIYAAIPTLDGTSPTLPELELGARFIKEALAAGRKILVHCTFGHGRSAAMVVAALLLMGEAPTVEDAFGILRKLKRRIWLSREQKRMLRLFSENMRRAS